MQPLVVLVARGPPDGPQEGRAVDHDFLAQQHTRLVQHLHPDVAVRLVELVAGVKQPHVAAAGDLDGIEQLAPAALVDAVELHHLRIDLVHGARDRIAQAAILYLEGYLWDPEQPRQKIDGLLGRAHARPSGGCSPRSRCSSSPSASASESVSQ